MKDDRPDAPLQTEYVTVDALEGKYARVELPDGTTADWLISTLPKGVKEGDVLAVSGDDSDLHIVIDHTVTRERQQRAQSQLDALNQDAPGGEINL